jgi:predicted NAD/FAD-binding protein
LLVLYILYNDSIMAPATVPRKRVAIIGSGVAGLGALWALNRTAHDVYIYEATSRLGGQTNTVDFKNGKYHTAVDTGLIALNTATYRTISGCLHCTITDER